MKLIDCDVHPSLASHNQLSYYISDHFKAQFEARPAGYAPYPTPSKISAASQWEKKGPGVNFERIVSDPKDIEENLLEYAGVDYAILLPLVAVQSHVPELNAAVQSAVNEWQAATWLSEYNHHGRYRGSILVPINNIPAAVAEIEKWAGTDAFVQVLLPHIASSPYGNAQFHPLWEAANRHKLPVAIHAASVGRSAMGTPVGYCHYYLELHAVAEAIAFAAHCASFICEGVFEKFPDLKLVCIEGGFGWIGTLMWRLDRAWDQLRPDLPTLTRQPSDYLYEHVRFTTQPIEEPDQKKRLTEWYDFLDASRLLMFSSDYPHWDYDDPTTAMPRMKPDEMQRICYENAAELYGLAA